MTLSAETLLVVSLMMAVFAAVSTVGTSLFLGAGFERLRAGFETIKKQTAYFSDAIHNLDHRVDHVEKQSGYFFEAITGLEQAQNKPQPLNDMPSVGEEELIMTSNSDVRNANTDQLLQSGSFVVKKPANINLSEQFVKQAGRGIEVPTQENRLHFH